jgi:hypothetical protein
MSVRYVMAFLSVWGCALGNWNPAYAIQEYRFDALADAWVNESNPGARYGSYTYLSAKDRQGAAGIYLRFFPLPARFIEEHYIYGASIFLYQYQGTYSPGDTVFLHPVLQAWDEDSLSWEGMPSYRPDVVSSLGLFSGNNLWREWEISSDDASVWLAEGRYGLVAENTSDGDEEELFARFYSSEHASALLRPFLSVRADKKAHPAPEPAGMALLGMGLSCLAVARYFRR